MTKSSVGSSIPVNMQTKKPLPGWLPLAVGAVLVVQLAALGAWQVSRGLEKRAGEAAFSDATGFSAWQDGVQVKPFQRLKATGRYDGDRQLLLENIIVNSRNGYYVITPFRGANDEPLLLINRGWIEQAAGRVEAGVLEVPGGRITVRGRAGSLPRAGFKMGEAVSSGTTWPKMAVYPGYDEIAAALGQPVQPFVLLMDDADPHGFYRSWAPDAFGPGKHFGYALQWFAMSAVLLGLLIWNHRKKRFES
ncbi:MAG: SURF1 family protein [Gammaproteobacteria bacterium]|nr:SURF1 family protein [Gammaproteobacteria bacterium]